jgi:hypothetical protein
MFNKNLFALFILFILLNFACSNAVTTNSEANKTTAVNANTTNLPEGLSGNQIPLSANTTPGIPDPKTINTNANTKGTSSTPGIPDTIKLGKTPQPKNTPPIPGIPDEETLKKQINTPADKSMMDRKPPEFESNSGKGSKAKPQSTAKP